ncbi:MAG: glycosyltransferase [Acidobacteria bacterium]|nr:glycosyltransferase [Acidobacteriota bacterium]
MALVTLLSIAAVIGIALTTIELLAVAIVRRSERPFAGGPLGRASEASGSPRDGSMPTVSILKPLCGLDDDLEANLESFARIEGVQFELIASVADPADPAIAIFERVRSRHPEAPLRLVQGGVFGAEPKNRKVERLVMAARQATGEILLVSDSNVRIEPADIARTVERFSDPAVGCVSNVFRGEGARSFGARLEAMHLLTFVAPGAAIAALFEVPCVVGKSMALRRSTLEEIGGFERFIRILAEDQAIGLAVKRAGWRVKLSPVVVRNVVVSRSVRSALSRQVRWNRIRWSFSRFEYLSELLVNPLPIATLAAAGALVAVPELVAETLTLAIGAAFVRVVQAASLARLLEQKDRLRDALLAPVQDMLQFCTQFAPLLSNSVEWRGSRVRLGRGTELVEART